LNPASLKNISISFIYCIRQCDCLVHFADTTSGNFKSGSPAKKKKRSDPLFLSCQTQQTLLDCDCDHHRIMSWPNSINNIQYHTARMLLLELQLVLPYDKIRLLLVSHLMSHTSKNFILPDSARHQRSGEKLLQKIAGPSLCRKVVWQRSDLAIFSCKACARWALMRKDVKSFKCVHMSV
jgi:hypothetical protein